MDSNKIKGNFVESEISFDDVGSLWPTGRRLFTNRLTKEQYGTVWLNRGSQPSCFYGTLTGPKIFATS